MFLASAAQVVTRVLSPSEALQNDLKAKLAELEGEIERYRKENTALERVRREREKVKEPLLIAMQP